MAASPQTPFAALRAAESIAPEVADWRRLVTATLRDWAPDHDDGSEAQHGRFYMGLVMMKLRGRVPARDVAAVVREAVSSRAAALASRDVTPGGSRA
jgi:hypothetical protein